MNRTRTSPNWSEWPGGFDTVNTRTLYPTNNRFQIPCLAPPPPALLTETELPERLIPYRVRIRNPLVAARCALHGFRDDYRLEALWSRPLKTIGGLKPFGSVLTPDFSLYRDWPYAVQLWNTYRSRWLGAWWQEQGLRVIPTVSWSSPQSYEFCFLGLPQNSVVAIASVMIKRDRVACRLFSWGFEAMLRALQPQLILCYGSLPDPALARLAEQSPHSATIVSYPFQWEENRPNFTVAVAKSRELPPTPLLDATPQLIMPPAKTDALHPSTLPVPIDSLSLPLASPVARPTKRSRKEGQSDVRSGQCQ
jgi:hypothetical protein